MPHRVDASTKDVEAARLEPPIDHAARHAAGDELPARDHSMLRGGQPRKLEFTPGKPLPPVPLLTPGRLPPVPLLTPGKPLPPVPP
jgi:hypothetical protein